MKYITDFILAYDLYQELKNIQIGINLENLIRLMKNLEKYKEIILKPSDLGYLFNDYKKSNDICYGNLEMLRALKILKRISETRAEYKMTELGTYIISENEKSYLITFYKLFNNLKSIQVLKRYIFDNGFASLEEISNDLGAEMAYYNKLLMKKDWKKPFNLPITRTILEILFDLKILQIDDKTKNYYSHILN